MSVDQKKKISIEILNILDDNKDDITDGLYLELCNNLAEMNMVEEREEKESNNFYRVTYLYTKQTPDSSCMHTRFMSTLISDTEIIELKSDTANNIIVDIENRGYADTSCINTVLSHDCTTSEVVTGDNCSECESTEPVRSILLVSTSRILKLTKL